MNLATAYRYTRSAIYTRRVYIAVGVHKYWRNVTGCVYQNRYGTLGSGD